MTQLSKYFSENVLHSTAVENLGWYEADLSGQ